LRGDTVTLANPWSHDVVVGAGSVPYCVGVTIQKRLEVARVVVEPRIGNEQTNSCICSRRQHVLWRCVIPVEAETAQSSVDALIGHGGHFRLVWAAPRTSTQRICLGAKIVVRTMTWSYLSTCCLSLRRISIGITALAVFFVPPAIHAPSSLGPLPARLPAPQVRCLLTTAHGGWHWLQRQSTYCTPQTT
jgi:hypothetical protein